MTAPDRSASDPAGRPELVDARGVLCPVPIIRLARAAAALPDASLIELLTDDPAARPDVAAWCRLRGHELLLTEDLSDPVPGPPNRAPAPGEPEPHAPNPEPHQALRHRIRLRKAASAPAGGMASAPAEPSVRQPSP